MIGVGTQYVSKWLWGGGEGPCWFLNYTFSSGLGDKKAKLHHWQSTGPDQTLTLRYCGLTKKGNRARSMWGRLTLLGDRGEQGYTCEQCDDCTALALKTPFILCGAWRWNDARIWSCFFSSWKKKMPKYVSDSVCVAQSKHAAWRRHRRREP